MSWRPAFVASIGAQCELDDASQRVMLSRHVSPVAPWQTVEVFTPSHLMRFHMPAAMLVAHQRVPSASSVHSAPSPLSLLLWRQRCVGRLELQAAMTIVTSAFVTAPAATGGPGALTTRRACTPSAWRAAAAPLETFVERAKSRRGLTSWSMPSTCVLETMPRIVFSRCGLAVKVISVPSSSGDFISDHIPKLCSQQSFSA